MNLHRGAIRAVIVSITLAVAGCTSGPSGDPTIDPTTAAPTEPALTEPQAALALSCDELFSLAELQPLLTTPVQVRRDESSAPLGVRGASLEQVGASLCEFGGENRTDSSFDQGLRIQAVPNAAQQFDYYLQSMIMPELSRMDTIGDRSVLTCQGSEAFGHPQYNCWADFVVREFWVSVHMSDTADLNADAAADLVTGVLTTVATRIAESGAERSLWEPPAGADPSPLCSDSAAPAALLGEAPSAVGVEDASSVEQGVPIFACQWTGSTGSAVRVTALASGAWAFDSVAGSPGMIFHPWLRESTAFDVQGTDGALVTCVDTCYALISWQGSLVQLTFDEETYDPAAVAARLQAWGAALP